MKKRHHRRDDDQFWGTVSALIIIGIAIGLSYVLWMWLGAHIR